MSPGVRKDGGARQERWTGRDLTSGYPKHPDGIGRETRRQARARVLRN